jgi:hypothetical protein
MLIRSQNKLELVPLNKHLRIRIDEDLSLFQIGYWDIWHNDDYFNILGNYSTRKKALEVLDMIQKHYYQFINAQNFHSTTNASTTFQMPQNVEVENE